MILLPFHFLRLTGLKTALYDKSYSQQNQDSVSLSVSEASLP